MPLIAYGNGMLNQTWGFKKHKSNPSSKIWKNLKRRERCGQIVVVKIDEYYSSQVRLSFIEKTFDFI
jgi:hypothetical protein